VVDVWIYQNWSNVVCIYPPLQIISKLVIPVGASYFYNVCACCHLPSVTNQIDDHYYYYCKNTIGVENQPRIYYKINQQNGDDYDCIFIGSWIKSLFGHDLINLENFKQKQNFFLKLF
jgi:hypothetical protein